ncbi:MAG: type II toxin-antitoxin system RelE/ParE family toxin [Defluviitaleaceae bacterium]|nr:type II toxin-antitoxin system RelE/ParE family toxin [Defluviitaleaceae bacterium]
MNYRPMILDAANHDIEAIEEYLTKYSRGAVRRFFEIMKEQIRSLKTMPFSCPEYEIDPFFRRMILDDYILFYSVDEKRKMVIVHRIFHHSRDTDRRMAEYRASTGEL